MKPIKIISKPGAKDQSVLILNADKFKSVKSLDKAHNEAVAEAIKNKKQELVFNNAGKLTLVVLHSGLKGWELSESLRKSGAKAAALMNEHGKESVCIESDGKHEALAFAEGMALASYQFLKYKSAQNLLH